ncbi:hypothetical protein IWQ60_008379 [Tieghemiomyces parasiticus]|uniref:RGS domain-containing protein n=1 Tax=Tieghemiomyces parasiticus TaxID=78921 RepID=A0A9W7ZY27_9FUNG|nr:hypothetical protein IWQ60_008379 [Tieghemiomyces parasiticus]
MQLRVSLSIAAAIVNALLVITTTILFAYRGRREMLVSKNAILLTTIGATAAFISNEMSLIQIIFEGHYPCLVTMWTNYLGLTIWWGCVLARAVRLYLLYHASISRVARHKSFRNVYLEAVETTPASPSGMDSLQAKSTDLITGPAAGPEGEGPQTRFAHHNASRWFLRNQHRFTDQHLLMGVVALTAIMTVIAIIVSAKTTRFTRPPTDTVCTMLTWEYYPLITIVALLALLVAPVMVYSIWNIEDSLGIRVDLCVTIAATAVALVIYIVLSVKVWVADNQFWGAYGWIAMALFLSHCTSVAVPLIRTRRLVVSPSHSHLLTREVFYAAIDHPHLFEYFKAFSAANFCAEMTLFLEEYNTLKRRVFVHFNPNANFDAVMPNIIECPVHELPLAYHDDYTRLTSDGRSSAILEVRRSMDYDTTVEIGASGAANEKRSVAWRHHLSPPGTLYMSGDNVHDISAAADRRRESASGIPQDPVELYHVSALSSVRIPILQALYQSPAAAAINAADLNRLPISLHMAYYGFYETFIAPGSSLQANIVGRVADVITKRVNARDYTVDMFDQALQEVLNLLYINIFSKFVRSYHKEIQEYL